MTRQGGVDLMQLPITIVNYGEIMSKLWGIDLGGSKIEGVILEDQEDHKVIARIRVPTQADRGYQHILDQISKLLKKLEIESQSSLPQRIGMGTPGSIDSNGQTIKNSNTACLIGKDIKKDLQEKLSREIIIENDANLFALAESQLGAVKDSGENPQTIFGVIMGTGVGGGIVINGKILQGKHHIAGEWGHNYLSRSGGKCYCGRIGCVETVLSGPALQRYYQELSGDSLTLPEIYQQSLAGEAYAQKTIKRLLHFLPKALANVINILDPQLIILGGGVSNIPELYSEIQTELTRYIFNQQLHCQILPPKLGDSAGVLGAALLSEN